MNHQISFADISSQEKRDDYIQRGPQVEQAAIPGQSVEELLLEVPEDDPILPPANVVPAPPRQRSASVERKRQYVFVTSEQRARLTTLYELHGSGMPAEWYHKESGVPLRNCQNLLTQLRKGEDLTPSRIRRGRTRVLQPEHTELILAFVRDKTEATLKELVNLVTEYEERKGHDAEQPEENQLIEGQDIEAELAAAAGAEGSDAAGSEEEENSVQGHMTDDESTEDEVENVDSQQPEEEEIDEPCEPPQKRPFCSISTMARHLEKGIIAHGHQPLTYKVVSRRSPHGNTPELKEKRREVARLLWNLYQKGKKFLFVDETHWETGKRCTRGWSSKGQKALSCRPFQRTKFTSIAVVSSTGEKTARVFKGTVTAAIFLEFMAEILNWHSERSRDKIIVYMDNAPVHNPPALKRLVERAGHTLVFGPKYSPEMNPIELVFGFWKKRVDRAIMTRELTETNVLQVIADAFDSLGEDEMRAAVSHVFTKVYKKVFDGEDI